MKPMHYIYIHTEFKGLKRNLIYSMYILNVLKKGGYYTHKRIMLIPEANWAIRFFLLQKSLQKLRTQ